MMRLLAIAIIVAVNVAGAAQLFVSSDVEDDVFAVLLSERLGTEMHVLVLEDPRSRFMLGNYWFLARYDVVYLLDLNSAWSYGGGLTEAEWETVMDYVRDGGVAVVGLNTVVGSSDVDAFRRAARVDVRHITIEGTVPLTYGDAEIQLNGTYGLLEVYPAVRHAIIARHWSGAPAIVVMELGRGALVVVGFNAVKEAVENGKLDLLSPIVDSVYVALRTREGPEGPLRPALAAVLGSLSPLEIAVVAFFAIIGVSLVLARVGLLPFIFTLGVVKLFSPIVCRSLDRRGPYAEIIDLLPTRLSTFRALVGRAWRWYLAALTVSGHALLVWDGEYFVMSRDPNRLGELGGRYADALVILSERRAIYLAHMAALLGVSYDMALRMAKDLARLNVVTLRKHPVDLIVYYVADRK